MSVASGVSLGLAVIGTKRAVTDMHLRLDTSCDRPVNDPGRVRGDG